MEKEKLKTWLDGSMFLTTAFLFLFVFFGNKITSNSDKAVVIVVFFVMFVVTSLYFGNKIWEIDYARDVLKAILYLSFGLISLIYVFTGVSWILWFWVLGFFLFLG